MVSVSVTTSFPVRTTAADSWCGTRLRARLRKLQTLHQAPPATPPPLRNRPAHQPPMRAARSRKSMARTTPTKSTEKMGRLLPQNCHPDGKLVTLSDPSWTSTIKRFIFFSKKLYTFKMTSLCDPIIVMTRGHGKPRLS